MRGSARPEAPPSVALNSGFVLRAAKGSEVELLPNAGSTPRVAPAYEPGPLASLKQPDRANWSRCAREATITGQQLAAQ